MPNTPSSSHLTRRIAAATALLGLGGLGGVALSSSSPDRVAQATRGPETPIEVRTQVVRRTVRVIRRERPRHIRRPAPPVVRASAPAPAPAPAVPVAAAPPPPVSRTRVAAPRSPSLKKPLQTHTSGAKGHEGDDHEGGDD